MLQNCGRLNACNLDTPTTFSKPQTMGITNQICGTIREELAWQSIDKIIVGTKNSQRFCEQKDGDEYQDGNACVYSEKNGLLL